jgi:Bacterial protein of unknown function (DUF899)
MTDESVNPGRPAAGTVDAASPLTGPTGRATLLEAFEGRGQHIACYFMWWAGRPAAEQREGYRLHSSRDAGSHP